jgi:hypothetical protein
MSKMKVFDFKVDIFNLSTGEEIEAYEQVNPLLRQIPDIKQYVSIDEYGRVFYRDKIIRLFV